MNLVIEVSEVTGLNMRPPTCPRGRAGFALKVNGFRYLGESGPHAGTGDFTDFTYRWTP